MNTDTLQPFLGVDKSNPFFDILFKPETPNELLVHIGLLLLETVERGSFQEKLLIARLYNAGVKRCKLTEKFKYSRKTIQNWALLLKSGKEEDILKIAEGQGPGKKITDDRCRYIDYIFNKYHEEKGCHIDSFIAEQYKEVYRDDISLETIRLKLYDRKQKIKEKRELDKAAAAKEVAVLYYQVLYSEGNSVLKNILLSSVDSDTWKPDNSSFSGENTWRNENYLPSNFEKKSKYSPSLPVLCNDKFPIVNTHSGKILSCHHLGILLSRNFLDFISEKLEDISCIVRQWLAMILCGCQNIEQGRRLDYRAFELFIGKQKSSPNKQREELKLISTGNRVNSIFEQNIRMVKAENDNTYLLDPHGIPYSGQLPIPKCWPGGSHTIGKGYYLDLIHSVKGEPVFSIINDNYYDLRQRFTADVEQFRKILGGDRNRTLTFVVDRAIYGVNFMKEVQKKNIHIITWEKDWKKGEWDSNSKYPVKTFSIMKYRNRKEDTYTYTVQYFKKRWQKEESSAKYVVLLTKPNAKPVELSVICTDFMYDAQTAITLILTRWIQENDMGYLIMLGINQITSYLYESYEDIAETITDRNIENKEFTRLTAEKLSIKKKIGLILLNREIYTEKKEQQLTEMEEDREKYSGLLNTPNLVDSKRKSIETKLKKLNTKIKRLPKDKEKSLDNNRQKQNELWQKIKIIDEKINNMPREMSRLEDFIRKEYVRLNFMPKSFMDAVKITARNIIYELLKIFRPIWNNYRNDLLILRELISSMGHIEEDEKNIVIQLNPSRQFSKKEKTNILLFLFEISNRVNKNYNLDKIIIFSLYEI